MWWQKCLTSVDMLPVEFQLWKDLKQSFLWHAGCGMGAPFNPQDSKPSHYLGASID